MTDADSPYEKQLTAEVDSIFTSLDLVRLTRQMMANRWYPQVPELDVIRSLDHFFGGITDVRVVDGDADDDLPLPNGTWDGSTFRPAGEDGDR